MINHGIYCIWDRKAGIALPAFSSQNDTSAVRTFTEAVMTSETPVSQYPADFDLMRIGTVDLETGTLTGLNPSDLLINGLVALTDAQRERSRYQRILNPSEVAQSAPEA